MKQALFLAIIGVIVLTGVYTIITVYDSNMKIGRLYQTPVIRPHEMPLLVMDKRAVASHKNEKLINKALKPDFATALAGSSDMILVKGKKDYLAFCSHCHGINLDGLGTVGQSFFPFPTDLTGDKVTRLSDKEIFTFISYGSKKTPALASSMSVESRKAVIQFVRFMQKTTH